MELKTDFALGFFIWQFALLMFTILWIYGIVKVMRGTLQGNKKLGWLLIVVLIPVLGSVLYLIIERGRNVKLTSH